MVGVRRGAFTCVGWQVTLCDPIWQVTSHSSEMGFTPGRAISAFTFTFRKGKKGKGTVQPLMEVFHGTATECHLPHGITQCYLLPDTSEHPALTPAMHAGTRFTYPGGMDWKADLTYS